MAVKNLFTIYVARLILRLMEELQLSHAKSMNNKIKYSLIWLLILVQACTNNPFVDEWDCKDYNSDLEFLLREGYITKHDYVNLLFYLDYLLPTDSFFIDKTYADVFAYLKMEASELEARIEREKCEKNLFCLRVLSIPSDSRDTCGFYIIFENHSDKILRLSYLQIKVYISPFYLSSVLGYDYFNLCPLTCMPDSMTAHVAYFRSSNICNDFVLDSVFSKIDGRLCSYLDLEIDSFRLNTVVDSYKVRLGDEQLDKEVSCFQSDIFPTYQAVRLGPLELPPILEQ